MRRRRALFLLAFKIDHQKFKKQNHSPPLFDRSTCPFNRSLNCLFTAANPTSRVPKRQESRGQHPEKPKIQNLNLLYHPMRRFLYIILCTATAMIGYTIHGSLFWSIMNFIFWPIAWAKWLICKEVSLSVIKQTFAFLLA